MKNVQLKELVGGALQEKFGKSFERVIENLQDINTPYKDKRKLEITMAFSQNESRDDVQVEISVKEKLASQAGIKTSFFVGKDLKTGEIFAEEYGKQIKGQVSINDLAKQQESENLQQIGDKVVDTETGEVMDSVVDFRKVVGE